MHYIILKVENYRINKVKCGYEGRHCLLDTTLKNTTFKQKEA